MSKLTKAIEKLREQCGVGSYDWLQAIGEGMIKIEGIYEPAIYCYFVKKAPDWFPKDFDGFPIVIRENLGRIKLA